MFYCLIGGDPLQGPKTPVHTVQSVVDNLASKYPRLFSKDTTQAIEGFVAQWRLKADAKPVFSRPFPLPFALVSAMDTKLDTWLEEGKIVPVRYSEWASPCLLVNKPNKCGTGESNVSLKPGEDKRCIVDFKRTLNPALEVDICPPHSSQ